VRFPSPPQNLFKRPSLNNQIRAREVRLIDEQGKQLGVFPLEVALRMARERSLDLIQVTEKVRPPVCKIADYGKYLYWLKKKAKKVKRVSETKIIRLGFNISPHDMEIRAKKAEEFLKKGDKIKVEIILRGREKRLKNFAKEKVGQFLQILNAIIPIKTEGELKKEPRGFKILITKK